MRRNQMTTKIEKLEKEINRMDYYICEDWEEKILNEKEIKEVSDILDYGLETIQHFNNKKDVSQIIVDLEHKQRELQAELKGIKEGIEIGRQEMKAEVKKMIENIRDNTLEIDDESCAVILQRLKELKNEKDKL